MRNIPLPPCLSFSDHSQYVIGNDVKVLDIGIVDVFEFVVVDEIAEKTFQVCGQLLFEVLQREDRAIASQRRINVKFDVRAKQGSETLQDASADILVRLLFKDFLQGVYSHSNTDFLSFGNSRQIVDQSVVLKVI